MKKTTTTTTTTTTTGRGSGMATVVGKGIISSMSMVLLMAVLSLWTSCRLDRMLMQSLKETTEQQGGETSSFSFPQLLFSPAAVVTVQHQWSEEESTTTTTTKSSRCSLDSHDSTSLSSSSLWWGGRTDGDTNKRCKQPTYTKELVTSLEDDSVLLIHIGKAGGTSLRILRLDASEECERIIRRRRDDDDESGDDDDDDDDDNNDDDDTSSSSSEDLYVWSSQHWDQNQTVLLDLAHACAFRALTSGKASVHLNRRHEAVGDYQYYVVPVRSPIDRLISWFNYESDFMKKESSSRQSQRLMHLLHCYPDVNSLLMEGLAATDVIEALESESDSDDDYKRDSCRGVAQECLTGEYPCYAHNFYNYEWYLERLMLWRGDYVTHLENPSELAKERREFRVDVIRVEHAIQDLNRTLSLWTQGATPPLESRGNVLRHYHQARPNGKISERHNNRVDPNGLRQLCSSICPELIVYKKILYHSDNLYDHEIQESYDELDNRCGVNVDELCGVDFYYRDYYNYKKDRICNPNRIGKGPWLAVGGRFHPWC